MSRKSQLPDLLDAALTYHRQYGWCVVPADIHKKKPDLPGWMVYQNRRPTEDELRSWFDDGKTSGLGVICGTVSDNLAIIDFDDPAKYEWFTRNHPELSGRLPTERTARGYHVLLRCIPTGTQTPKDQNVELRSAGSFTIISPSPGKSWIQSPNGEIPEIDPFALGLDRFGIVKPKCQKPLTLQKPFSSVSSVNQGLVSSVKYELDSSVKCSERDSSVKLEFSPETQVKIESAIDSTLPTEIGQRNQCLFGLCRRLKGIAELRDLPAGSLREVVKDWHARALPVIATKPFDESWADFAYGWTRVRWPHGIQLAAAVEAAMEDVDHPPEAANYKDTRNALLLRVCYQLQQINGGDFFYMSCRVAGGLIGVSHVEGSKRLGMLQADGHLAIMLAPTNRQATRYKYIRKGDHEADNVYKVGDVLKCLGHQLPKD